MRRLTGPVPPPHRQTASREYLDSLESTTPQNHSDYAPLTPNNLDIYENDLRYISDTNPFQSTSDIHSPASSFMDASSPFQTHTQTMASPNTRIAERYPRLPASGQNTAYNSPSNYSSPNSSSSLCKDAIAQQLAYQVNNSTHFSEQDPFGGYPESVFPTRMDEKEDDDYLHNPDPVEDAKFDKRWQGTDLRGCLALSGFLFLCVGGFFILIVLPILAFTGITARSPPENGNHRPIKPTPHVPSRKPVATDYKYGILGALRSSLIDSDTPDSAHKWTSLSGDEWELVFSDEFNLDGRTFHAGEDLFWEAPDFHYAATTDLEWYTPDAVTTENGTLKITLDAFYNHNLNYRSAMIQSWNKLCFTQGYIEVQCRLPGSGTTSGLWPGIWTLGNLARPGFLATSDGLWPYSYNECDAGITANQSSIDGISYLPGQRLPKCTCSGEDHPSPGKGRGAPEIDILEGNIGTKEGFRPLGLASMSLQIAPFDVFYQVDYDFVEIYHNNHVKMNPWTGGPFQQAVSGVVNLNEDYYEQSGNSFQSFGFEYLNDDAKGYVTWYVGQEKQFSVFAPSLGPNGNVGQRHISKEPMSIIINLGLSNSWTYINWPELVFPMTFLIDHVRIYQPKGTKNINCSPKDYPTSQYIEDHKSVYSNWNLTKWHHADYKRPKNSLVDRC